MTTNAAIILNCPQHQSANIAYGVNQTITPDFILCKKSSVFSLSFLQKALTRICEANFLTRDFWEFAALTNLFIGHPLVFNSKKEPKKEAIMT